MALEPCPHCGMELDDGDIYEKIRNSYFYKENMDEEVIQIAHQYGWTQQNQKRFSKKVIIQPIGGGTSYAKCPHCNTKILSG